MSRVTGREKEQGRNPSQRNDFERQCLGFETRNHDEGPRVKELIIQMSTTKQEIAAAERMVGGSSI